MKENIKLMIIKIFGTIDLISGLLLIFSAGVTLTKEIYLFFGIILFIKSTFGFYRDFASYVDLIAALIFLFSFFFFPVYFWISLIIGVLEIQKGAISFL